MPLPPLHALWCRVRDCALRGRELLLHDTLLKDEHAPLRLKEIALRLTEVL
jgi:hypothetical protein